MKTQNAISLIGAVLQRSPGCPGPINRQSLWQVFVADFMRALTASGPPDEGLRGIYSEENTT